ncbi:hypothetical protein ACHAWT_006841 [Skeletonema menzelii]
MLQVSQLILLFTATAATTNAWSLQTQILNAIKSSSLLNKLHQQHIESPTVSHMMKSTPLVDAPDSAKLQFATSFMGQVLANIMAKEQQLLGDWKIEKIVEAAGSDFDEEVSHDNLMRILRNGYYDSENLDSSVEGLGTHRHRSTLRSPIVLFSFVDCPWCLLAKQLLQQEEYQQLLLDNEGTLQIIELEELGLEGKHLRASISLATGRTSMPACFIGEKSVGGYTDGFSTDHGNYEERRSEGFMFVPRPEVDLRMMESKGLASLHETGELKRLILGT